MEATSTSGSASWCALQRSHTTTWSATGAGTSAEAERSHPATSSARSAHSVAWVRATSWVRRTVVARSSDPIAQRLGGDRREHEGVGQRVAVQALTDVEVEQHAVARVELTEPGPEPRREDVAVGLVLVGPLGHDDLGAVEAARTGRAGAPRRGPRPATGAAPAPVRRGR